MLRTLSTACALLFFASSPVLAQSSGNAVHLGQDIVVATEQSVNEGVCFLCSVRVEGATRGGLVVVAGNVYLNGTVHGDVVVLGGHVTLTGRSSIGGSLVVFGGHLYQDPAAAIGRDRVLVRPIVFLPIILFIGAIIAGLIFLLRYLFHLG